MARAASILSVIVIVAACGAGPRGNSEPTTAPAPTTAATAALAATLRPSPAPIVDHGFQFVLLRQGNHLALAESAGGVTMQTVPAGVPTPDWRSVYSVDAVGSGTRVRRIAIEGGQVEASWTLDGAWALPTIGTDSTPTGLSADGGTLVLVEANPGATQTRFAVLATGDTAATAAATPKTPAPKIVTLPGRLAYDAIALDGARLFVLEYQSTSAGSDYAVRSVDLAKGSLDDGVIADKRDAAEVMGGVALQQQQGLGGVFSTLYQGPKAPFIHQLQTADRIAWCIDLPAVWGRHDASAGAWGVALDPGAPGLFVANGALGVAAEVNLADFSVTRSVTFPPTALLQAAKFVTGAEGSSGTGLAIDAARQRLYVAGPHGVTVLSTLDLSVEARLAPGIDVVSLSVAANGTVLYLVGRDGTASRVDAATGELLSSLKGGGFSEVLRVVDPN